MSELNWKRFKTAMEHIEGCIPCDIRATSMVKISQEYKSVSRIQLRSNSLFIQRPTIWSPQMRTRNRNSGAILFRRFGQRRHTADHDWHHCIGRVVVTFHIKSVTAFVAVGNSLTYRRDAAPVAFRQG